MQPGYPPHRGRKERYRVDRIETASDIPAGPNPSLYRVTERTHVVISKSNTVQETPAAPAASAVHFQVDANSFGGLDKQIAEINENLAHLTTLFQRPWIRESAKERSKGLLIYGPTGTGKSKLLRNITCGDNGRRVHTLDCRMGSPQTVKKLLDKACADAEAIQPSVVAIDGLDLVAGRTDSTSSSSLATSLIVEIEKARGSDIMFVATCTRRDELDERLRASGCFPIEIEIPVPDVGARLEILKARHGPLTGRETSMFTQIAERTHGFVGRDIHDLYWAATLTAEKRRIAATRKAQPLLSNGTGLDTHPNADSDRPSDAIEDKAPTLELADFEPHLRSIRPTALKEIFLERPKVTWNDIGGYDNVKKLLKLDVKLMLDPRGPGAGLPDPPKGILFYGPPGCSKTLTAQALANEAGLNFLSVKGAELTNMYVGETERNIRECFRKARAARPSMIFFDEIDSIGASSQTKGLNTVTTLLTEMDGFESLEGVLVLAATNRPDKLDPALRRPGRFSRLIYVGLPDGLARQRIFEISTKRKPLSEDVRAEELSKQLDGYTGAEIVEVCNRAHRHAYEEKTADDESAVVIAHKHFEAVMHSMPKLVTAELLNKYEGLERSIGSGM